MKLASYDANTDADIVPHLIILTNKPMVPFTMPLISHDADAVANGLT